MDQKKNIVNPIELIILGVGTLGLTVSSRYSYLLFHTLAEAFAVVVSAAIFIFAWHTRAMQKNHYFLFLGIAYLHVAALDLAGALAYKGMNVLPGIKGSDPTVQLWIAARYLESLSLLVAPVFLRRRLHAGVPMFGYTVATIAVFVSIFTWPIFPSCFVEGSGLTAFKVYSEYVICLLLIAALVALRIKRADINATVFQLMTTAIFLTVGAELAFTFYTDIYGVSNLVGHVFKIISFFLIYKAVVETGLKRPFDLLFRELGKQESVLEEMVEERTSALRESEQSLIEARDKLEIRVAERTVELEIAKERAESADRLKSMFLATMSHELRSPLNSVIGFTGVLLKRLAGPLTDEQEKQLGMIRKSAGHLLEHINEILDFTKIEAARMQLVDETYELKSQLSEWVQTLAPQIEEKGLQLRLNQPAEPVVICGDQRRLRQVVINLLTNAVKFTNSGRVVVDLNTVAPARFQIRVSDTGVGIAPEERARIFEPFTQARSGRHRSSAGTGLGLSISHRLVGLMGGTIELDSTEGRGSTFTVVLPLQRDTPGEAS